MSFLVSHSKLFLKNCFCLSSSTEHRRTMLFGIFCLVVFNVKIGWFLCWRWGSSRGWWGKLRPTTGRLGRAALADVRPNALFLMAVVSMPKARPHHSAHVVLVQLHTGLDHPSSYDQASNNISGRGYWTLELEYKALFEQSNYPVIISSLKNFVKNGFINSNI